MRKKRPYVADIDEVPICRQNTSAVIEYRDLTVSTVHLEIGEKIRDMTDQQILDLHNEVLQAQQKLAAEHVYFAAEIPEGRPQIRYFERGDQWVPRGDVLRCVVSDGGEDGEATGRLEGINNKIKVIKRVAYGFHDLRYFALKVKQAFPGQLASN